MSRSHLLAGLFLILGAVDLVLLNVWLVPAAWPPSSGPIAMPTTPAELEPTPEVEETLVERSMVPAEAAVLQHGPAVVPEFADTAVEHEETTQSTVGQAEDDPVAETTAAVEPPQRASVVPDSASTAVEHEETFQSTAGQAADDPMAEKTAVEPPQLGVVVPDSASTAVEPKEEAERTAAPFASLSTAAVESNSVQRDSEKTEQAVAEPEYRTVHHAVVRFNSDGDSLSSADRDILGEAFRLYRDYLDAEIQVDGHTDNRGRDDYNDRLSERRARAVAGVLEAEGIPSARIQILGHGSSQPLDSKNSAAARAKNRRVEITIRSRLP